MVIASSESLRACVRLELGFQHAVSHSAQKSFRGLLQSPFTPTALSSSLPSGNALVVLVICLLQVLSKHAEAWDQICPSFFFIDKMDHLYLHFISHLLISFNNRKIPIYIQHYQLYHNLNLMTHVFCTFSTRNICLKYSKFVTITTSVPLFWLPVSTTRDIPWLPHHVFLVQATRNNEYEDMNLELASLFRHIIVVPLRPRSFLFWRSFIFSCWRQLGKQRLWHCSWIHQSSAWYPILTKYVHCQLEGFNFHVFLNVWLEKK